MVSIIGDSASRPPLQQDSIPRSASTFSSKSSTGSTTGSSSAGVGVTEGVSSSGSKEPQRSNQRRRHSFHDSPRTPTVLLPPQVLLLPPSESQTSAITSNSEAERSEATQSGISVQDSLPSISTSVTPSTTGMYAPLSPQAFDYHQIQSALYPSFRADGIPLIQPFGAYHNPYEKYGSWNSGYDPDQGIGGQGKGEMYDKSSASTPAVNIDLSVVGERRTGKCKFFSVAKVCRNLDCHGF